MELEGKVWKDGKEWLIEVPALDVCTQGFSRKDALRMIKDAIEVLIEGYFPGEDIKKIGITVHDCREKSISITSSNNSLMVSFLLIRQRELSKSSVREVVERLGSKSKSPNVYAQYERGNVNITLNQCERLLEAVNPKNPPRLRIA